MTHARTAVLHALFVLAVVGCGADKPTKSTHKEVAQVPEAPSPPSPKPISDAEAEAFARELQAAVAKKDVAKVVSLMRVDRIVERVLGEVNPCEENQRLVRGRLKSELGERFAKRLVANLQPGVRFDLLRVRRSPNGPVAVYRLLGEPGANYYLMTLERAETGNLAVRSYTILMDGLPIEESIRRMLLEAEANFGPAARSKLKDRERGTLDVMEHYRAFGRLALEGKYAEALQTYRKLPPDVRADRLERAMVVHCARHVSDEEFAKEFTAFRTAYPKDPALLMMALSFHESRGEHGEHLKAIDALEAVVGSDPHLDVLRAAVHRQEAKVEETIAAAEKAIRTDPTLGEAYWFLADFYLERKAHAKVADTLRAVIEHGKEDFDPDQLGEEKAYSVFCKSQEFAEFRKWYSGRKK